MINQRRSKILFTLKHIVKLSIQKRGINVLNRRESEAFLQSGVKEICARWNQEEVPPGLKRYVYSNFQSSRAQLQQDLVAQYLSENLACEYRFFVEFGATDGVTLSNSHFLEAHGWRGVLVEPDINWHSELEKNRKSQIDKRCVYSESGLEIEFINSNIGELSGVKIHASNDGWGLTRANGTTSTVETVSLQDLLVEYEAPRKINYLSIDTEGSEYEIIKNFDFQKWDVVFVSIEHNFGDNQAKIAKKMEENEYVRVLETISAWDAWYIKNEYLTGFFRQ